MNALTKISNECINKDLKYAKRNISLINLCHVNRKNEGFAIRCRSHPDATCHQRTCHVILMTKKLNHSNHHMSTIQAI